MRFSLFIERSNHTKKSWQRAFKESFKQAALMSNHVNETARANNNVM